MKYRAFIFTFLFISSCSSGNVGPYNVEQLTHVKSINEYKREDKSIGRNVFWFTSDYCGNALPQYSASIFDYTVCSVEAYIHAFPFDVKIDCPIEIEENCKNFISKYYFLSKEKMFDIFPPESVSAKRNRLINAYDYIVFKVNSDNANTYHEYRYLFNEGFLILDTYEFYKEGKVYRSNEIFSFSTRSNYY